MLGLLRRLISISVKLGIAAAGVGVIIGYANLSNVQGWSADLKAQVFQVSGRRLNIDGPIDFTLTMPPRIVIEGIRLQNVGWGKKGDMLKAKALVAEVDMLPLMVGDVAVPRVRLVEPEILVEVGKSGRSNWDELTKYDPSVSSAPPLGGINVPAVLSGGNLTLSGGTVTVSNAGATTIFKLPTTTLDVGINGLPCL